MLHRHGTTLAEFVSRSCDNAVDERHREQAVRRWRGRDFRSRLFSAARRGDAERAQADYAGIPGRRYPRPDSDTETASDILPSARTTRITGPHHLYPSG